MPPAALADKVAVRVAGYQVRPIGSRGRPVGRGHRLGRTVVSWEALRPAALDDAFLELRGDHEIDSFLDRSFEARVFLFQVHAQHELCGDRRGGVVESGIAVIVLEFLQPPAVDADGLIPFLQRGFAGEVEGVIPATRGVLRFDQCQRGALCRLIEDRIARGVVSVQEAMPHRRGRDRLHPAHRRVGFHLAPAFIPVGREIFPNVAPLERHGLVHVGGGARHGAASRRPNRIGFSRRFNRSRRRYGRFVTTPPRRQRLPRSQQMIPGKLCVS